MRSISTRARRLSALSLAVSPFVWATALGQSAPEPANTATPAPAAAGQDAGLADIVVTAQRRSESAQTVPISLQSFSSAALERTATRSTEDLTNVVGGLVIVPTAARPAIYVRGVGTNSANTTPAVLTFIDGVYQPFGASTDLVNLQSMEVLKGPQGTLFGRNATGGVIQITTKPPSETLGAKVEVGYGNYRTVDTSAYVTGGLGKGVAVDLALRYNNQDKGFGTNLYNGEDVFLTKRVSARSRLRAELGDSVTATVVGDYSRVSGTVGTNVSPIIGGCLNLGGTPGSAGSLAPGGVQGTIQCKGGPTFPGDFDVNAGPYTPFYRTSEWGVAGTLEGRLGDLTARSISSYRQGQEHYYIDFDGTPAPTTNVNIDRDPRKSFTQELQLLSGNGGRLQWVAGAFYFHATNNIPRYQIGVNSAVSNDKDDSLSGYGQATYEIVPKTKLTLGGRYTHEKRSIAGYVTVNGVQRPGSAGSDSQTFNEFTWRAALDHNFSKDVMVYGSVSRGFNSGFFNQASLAGFANRTQNPAVLPEFLTSYEIGTKADFFGRRLRVNLSGFIYDYKGLQQQIYNSGAVVTINAGAAQIKGVDFEIVARPVRSLTLSLNGTYLDSHFKSYPAAPNYVMLPDYEVVLPIGNEVANAAGKKIVNTPEWSYTFTATHALPTAVGEFETTGNLNYRGKTFADPVNRFALPTRYVFNLSERWTSLDKHFFVSVWAKNLFDKHYDYAFNILAPRGLIGQTAPPRTYGATVGFNY